MQRLPRFVLERSFQMDACPSPVLLRGLPPRHLQDPVRDGILIRHQENVVPPRVRYALSKYGWTPGAGVGDNLGIGRYPPSAPKNMIVSFPRLLSPRGAAGCQRAPYHPRRGHRFQPRRPSSNSPLLKSLGCPASRSFRCRLWCLSAVNSFLDQHAIWRNIGRYRKEWLLSLLYALGRLVGIEPTTS